MPQKVTENPSISSVSYTLRRSRRRTIAVEVHPHGALIVRSPLRVPISEIEGFLVARRFWIAARLADAKNARSVIPPLPPGHLYSLGEVVSVGDFVGGFAKDAAQPHAIHRSTVRLIKSQIQKAIVELLPELGVAALRYQRFTVRKMRRRWGSCRVDGVLTFNEHLVMVPERCIRAVVAHELAHLVHMHHGPEFKDLARQILPDYDEADELLDAWTAVLQHTAPETNNGARGPVEQRTLWFGTNQADAPAQISSNADVSEAAIISGVRPSMW